VAIVMSGSESIDTAGVAGQVKSYLRYLPTIVPVASTSTEVLKRRFPDVPWQARRSRDGSRCRDAAPENRGSVSAEGISRSKGVDLLLVGHVPARKVFGAPAPAGRQEGRAAPPCKGVVAC
jgi:hypothetical protein